MSDTIKEIIEIVINNGLGVASFLALLYFMYNSMSATNTCLKDIKDTLVLIQSNLIKLSERVSDIEYKLKDIKYE